MPEPPTTCEAPTNVQWTYKKGPRAFAVTWDYAGTEAVAFIVTLERSYGPPVNFLEQDETTVGNLTRKATFQGLHSAVGQSWRATVTAICKDCSWSDIAYSPIGIIL